MNKSSNRGFGLASIAMVVVILGISAMFTQASEAEEASPKIIEKAA